MKKFLCLTVVCLFLGSAGVFAEEMQCSKEMMEKCKSEDKMHKGNYMGDKDVRNASRYLKFKEALALSSDQVSSLEKIRTDFQKNSVQIHADIKVAQIDLNSIIKQDNPDFTQARAKVKEISDLQLKYKTSMIVAYENAYNTLTAEQKSKLSQLKAEHKKKIMEKK